MEHGPIGLKVPQLPWNMVESDIPPLIIKGDYVEQVLNFRFLGVHIKEGLTWSANPNPNPNSWEILKKSRQRLHFLRVLKKNNITQRRFTNCTTAQRKALQKVINTAQKITRPRRAQNIVKDTVHPGRSLFELFFIYIYI